MKYDLKNLEFRPYYHHFVYKLNDDAPADKAASLPPIIKLRYWGYADIISVYHKKDCGKIAGHNNVQYYKLVVAKSTDKDYYQKNGFNIGGYNFITGADNETVEFATAPKNTVRESVERFILDAGLACSHWLADLLILNTHSVEESPTGEWTKVIGFTRDEVTKALNEYCKGLGDNYYSDRQKLIDLLTTKNIVIAG